MFPVLLLVAVNGYILWKAPNSTKPKPSPKNKKVEKEEDKYIVYGTMSCGWTRKQLDYMKQKKIPYEFVDCEKEPEKCKDLPGYPGIKFPDGTKKVGYTEV